MNMDFFKQKGKEIMSKGIIVLKFMQKILEIYKNSGRSISRSTNTFIIYEISFSLRVLFEKFCTLFDLFTKNSLKHGF